MCRARQNIIDYLNSVLTKSSMRKVINYRYDLDDFKRCVILNTSPTRKTVELIQEALLTIVMKLRRIYYTTREEIRLRLTTFDGDISIVSM